MVVAKGQAIAECTECKCVIHHKSFNMSKLTHLKHDTIAVVVIIWQLHGTALSSLIMKIINSM